MIYLVISYDGDSYVAHWTATKKGALKEMKRAKMECPEEEPCFYPYETPRTKMGWLHLLNSYQNMN